MELRQKVQEMHSVPRHMWDKVRVCSHICGCKRAEVSRAPACRAQGVRIPVFISGTIVDNSGRTLSGQTNEAFWNSISHAKPLAVGLNCALGAKQMKPFLQRLSAIASCYVFAYPNAGLPNAMGGYDDTPAQMADDVSDFAKEGLLNMTGGQRVCARSLAIAALVDLVLNLALVPLFGVMGAAVAVSAALLTGAALNYRAACARLGYDIGIWAVVRR